MRFAGVGFFLGMALGMALGLSAEIGSPREDTSMKGLLLWVAGVPLSVVVLLYFIGVLR
jgi:hypothetical protein